MSASLGDIEEFDSDYDNLISPTDQTRSSVNYQSNIAEEQPKMLTKIDAQPTKGHAARDSHASSSGFPLKHSSNLLCFFKCICHLEDSETFTILLLLDSFNIYSVEDLEQALLISEKTILHCFQSIGLEAESISHIISCMNRIGKIGILPVSVPLTVQTSRRQRECIGLDCIDSPMSSETVSPAVCYSPYPRTFSPNALELGGDRPAYPERFVCCLFFLQTYFYYKLCHQLTPTTNFITKIQIQIYSYYLI